jgi:tetratricopeptide (TPR) repeat protein
VQKAGSAVKGRMIMMRSILIAVGTGLLVALPIAYVLTGLDLQDRPLVPTGAGHAKFAAAIPIEAWPICSSTAETADWAALDPDFLAGKRAIVAGDWNAAIKALTSAGLRDDHNADIQHCLGYAYRRLRQFDSAIRHYEQALTLNPRHRGAHEHLGEAYLAQGDLAKATEHLAALEQICLIPCDEYDDLAHAIAEFNKIAQHQGLFGSD